MEALRPPLEAISTEPKLHSFLSGSTAFTIVLRVSTSAQDSFRVLFVCWGNICRSPAGENVFRHLLSESDYADSIECDSAGTIDAHAGNSPDQRMGQTLEQRGIKVEGAARQIRTSDFDTFDLILTMDDFNRQEVLVLTRSKEDRAKVRSFTEFCQEHEATEVPDPYYGGDSGFELVADLITDGCQGLLEHIESRLG